MGQIALGEAEHVVVVVILGLFAVVMHGSNRQGQLIDGGSVDGGHDNAQGVVASLLDALDVGSRITGLDTGGVLAGLVAQLGLDEGGDGGTGRLVVDAVVGQVVAEGVNDHGEPVGSGGVGGEAGIAVAPQSGSGGHIGSAVGFAVSDDLLDELDTGGVKGGPEGVVLLLGEVLGSDVAVTAGSQDQVLTGVHTGAVGFHTQDGLSVQGGGTVIGGVAQNVHGEDDVVNVQLVAVGELDAVADDEVIVHGTVGVLGDGQIGDAVVGVVGAVEGLGLALNALQDHGAGTVRTQQTDLGHRGNVLVIGSCGKEGGELAAEGRVTDDQGSVVLNSRLGGSGGSCGGGGGSGGGCGGLGGGSGFVVAAAGKATQAQSQSQYQRQDLGASLHGEYPPF